VRLPGGLLRPDLLEQAADMFHVVLAGIFADMPPASLFEEQVSARKS
jgi:hypothetical protein